MRDCKPDCSEKKAADRFNFRAKPFWISWSTMSLSKYSVILSNTQCSEQPFFVQKMNFRKSEVDLTGDFEFKMSKKCKNFKFFAWKLVKIGFWQFLVSSIWDQNQDFWHKNSIIWYFLGWNLQEYLPILAQKFKYV